METYQIVDKTSESQEPLVIDDVVLEFNLRSAAEAKLVELANEDYEIKVIGAPSAVESDDTDGGV